MTFESVPDELLAARDNIDEIDAALIDLLATRFKLTHQVGLLKASNQLDAVDANREAQKLEKLRALCGESNINPELVTELFTKIMEEVVRNHRQIREGHS